MNKHTNKHETARIHTKHKQTNSQTNKQILNKQTKMSRDDAVARQ